VAAKLERLVVQASSLLFSQDAVTQEQKNASIAKAPAFGRPLFVRS